MISDSAEGAVPQADGFADQVERFDSVAATVPDHVGPEPGTSSTAAAQPPLEAAESGGEAATSSADIGGETVKFYLKSAFDLMGVMFGEHWPLSHEQLKEATIVTLPLVQKWMPRALGTSTYKEEITWAIVMTAILAPRVQLTLEKQKQSPKANSGQRPAVGTRTSGILDTPVPANRFSPN